MLAEVGEAARGNGFIADPNRAFEQDDGVLVIGAHWHERRSAAEGEVDADVVGISTRRRTSTRELSYHHRGERAGELGDRQLGVVFECGRTVAREFGLGNPELDSVKIGRSVFRRFFGVRNAVASRHQVQLAWPDGLLEAEAVAVEDFPGEQPGHGLQTDVRMRADAEPWAGIYSRRADVIGEAPRTNSPPSPSRQSAPYRLTVYARLAARRDFKSQLTGRHTTFSINCCILNRYRTTHTRSIRRPARQHKAP